ncbi:MAG: ABC transporter permease, partial [Pirellulaceae bacterium]|nr:ABC transporter permease [Pirellulaceae bacterium]
LMIVSEGFFREDLASDLEQTDLFRSELELATPVIFFPNGTVERNQSESTKNLGQVTLLGIQSTFWQFDDHFTGNLPDMAADEVIINQVVADDLGLDKDNLDGARLTVGVPKQALLASDSSLGNKKDLVERIVDLKVVGIVPAKGLGRFGLHPTQIAPRLVYLPIAAMQDALNDGMLKYKDTRQQANMLLLATRKTDASDTEIATRVSQALSPTLGDLGLNLKHVVRTFQDVTVFDYFSLSSDRLVLPSSTADSIREAFPNASEVFTYLANDMIAVKNEAKSAGVPFSMVSAVDLESIALPSVSGKTVSPLTGNQIAVNSWTAKDQNLQLGDTVRLAFFEPETTHGEETEISHDFIVADIVEVTEPTEPPRVDRRQGIQPAVFSDAPTRANDPDFTPTVPGLTDADSIERWDLPFETADRIRPQDDDYWTYYRTTPKAFVSLDTARELWASRFGDTTSFQIPAAGWDTAKISQKLISQFRQQNDWPGLQVIPIKANGLRASAGSTPFDALFLSLSMFVIAAALALVSLLFRLAFQKRSAEMGTLLAIGFRQKQVARIWMLEMLGVCLTGSLLGIFLGIGYASLMIYGLKTWWVGAITTPFLNMHIGSFTLPLGMGLGLLICGITIGWSIRSARKQSVRGLLSGQLNSISIKPDSRLAKSAKGIVVGCTVLAVILTSLAATQLAGESQAGAFMASGFLILLAALIWIHQYIARLGQSKTQAISLTSLATTHAGRNPMRSTLTIGLVAVASFLILAISAFRLSPTEQGTAGFNYLATTSQPVFANLDTALGQREVLLGTDDTLDDTSRVLSFRFKEGED